jgi:hypothetical protein
MKNDLTSFEKCLIKTINLYNQTNYNYKHLMEWSSSKNIVKNNLKEAEILYEALGVFVAINPNLK